MNDPFFGLSSYHIALAICGSVIVLAYWLPRFLYRLEPASSALLIAGGAALFTATPIQSGVMDPVSYPAIWMYASEAAVVLALFGTGIRIDNSMDWRRWIPAARMLAITMPLCMIAVAIGGVWIGMTLASAVLLAAVLAPTDPVLAGSVQVGAPAKGGEHPVRFALTTEAGLNDALAFPFVYLAILVASTAALTIGDFTQWALQYVVYKIVVGTVLGAAAGWLLGMVLFVFPKDNPLAQSSSGVIAFAGIILVYGISELVEGYGFLAVFVFGLALRRVEADHEYHTRLHAFSTAIEHAITAVMLVLLGGAFPAVFDDLQWPDVALALVFLILIRPLAGIIGLVGYDRPLRERAFIAFYGVRGLGSIFYLAYASGQIEMVDEGRLWAITCFTIVASTVIHGFSASALVRRVTKPAT